MASLSSVYIGVDHLRKMLQICESGNRRGIEITVALNDAGNKFGKNVDAFIAQTAEQRQAKEMKTYVGSGNTFWTDGKVTLLKYAPDGTPPAAPAQTFGSGPSTPAAPNPASVSGDDDLPF